MNSRYKSTGRNDSETCCSLITILILLLLEIPISRPVIAQLQSKLLFVDYGASGLPEIKHLKAMCTNKEQVYTENRNHK